MKRRTVLAGAGSALGAAIAGCLAEGNGPDRSGSGANGDENGSANGGENGNRTVADFERRIAVCEVDDVPESVPVEFDVSVTDSAITANGTAVLEVTARNTGETELDVKTPFYKGLSGGDRGVMLWSFEAPDSPERGYVPRCIADPSPSQEFVEWTDEGPLTYTLGPGEAGRDELVVMDDPSLSGCFPPGEYRFESDHDIDGTEFAWGFTVEVTDSADGETVNGAVDRRYRECPREIIPYKQFPADVQSEIDAALEDSYTADRVFLREAMDTDESFVSVDGTYYEPVVSVEEGVETLALRVVDPKRLPKQRSVSVRHELNSQRMITAEVVAEDGRKLVEGTRDLRPGSEVEFGRIDLVGTHELRVTVADGDRIEHEFTSRVRIDRSRFNVIVVVEEDGITVTGAVAELGVCQYDD